MTDEVGAGGRGGRGGIGIVELWRQIKEPLLTFLLQTADTRVI